MSTTTDTQVRRRVRIIQEQDAQDPRTAFDNLGHMVCWHKRYELGDEQPGIDPVEWLREYARSLVKAGNADLIPDEHVKRILQKHAIVMPLFLMDHSGISMSTSSRMFAAFDQQGWDWGQVGVIVLSKAKMREEYGDGPDAEERARKYLEGEVEQYDQYLQGDVWGYVCEEERITPACAACGRGEERTWEHVDSCWGFYGHDVETNGMLENLPGEEWKDLLRKAETEY